MSIHNELDFKKNLLKKYVIEDDLDNFIYLINEYRYDDEFGYLLTTKATEEASINIIRYVFETNIIKYLPKHKMLLYAVGLPSLRYFTKDKDEFHNSLELMKLLLQYDMTNIDFPVSTFYLHSAAEQNNLDKIKLLIDNGINIIQFGSVYSDKTVYNNHETIKFMIDNGVEMENFNLNCALSACIIKNNDDGVEYYFSIGANINDLELDSVIRIIKYNSIQKLFDYKYDFNQLDYFLDNHKNKENDKYNDIINTLTNLTSVKTDNICILLSLMITKY
ncbi:hypothetical protein [Acanthamoeba polyphaga mimivirus]|nr:hypothetical protein [Acanthamoeba castellanii mamavirus]UMZ07866.1 hypothetical protein [Acanthamoeba polyphaga mimivirus]